MKKIILFSLLFLSVSIASAFEFFSHHSIHFAGPVFVVSLSSDGNYAISSHQNRYIILWNLKNKTHQIISVNGNIYSAYFIKNTSYFMYQDLGNVVHIDSIDGKEIKTWQAPYASYGEAITSDLKHYIASDVNWNLYNWDKRFQKDEAGFYGEGKLINFSFTPDDKYLLEVGAGGLQTRGDAITQISQMTSNTVILYQLEPTIKALKQFPGNVSKTFGTLSPDGQYVVAGDENGHAYNWETLSGKLAVDLFGLSNPRKKAPTPPNDFRDPLDPDSAFAAYDPYAIQSIKFLDTIDYIIIPHEIPYMVLYQAGNPAPLKYIKMDTDPYPAVNDYSRDEAMDSAPSSHRFIIGHDSDPGITLYQFDPKTQTMQVLWKTS
jgi:WD40 repeat protein